MTSNFEQLVFAQLSYLDLRDVEKHSKGIILDEDDKKE